MSILGLVDEVERHVTNVFERTSGPARRGDIRYSVGSFSRALRDLGFKCQMPFSEGLGALIHSLASDER